MKKKAMIIGLDGATWDMITPMMARGYLPNIQAIVANGAHGILASTTPPISPVAWTSMITGTNPGKHGILDFVIKDPDQESYAIKYLCGGDRKTDAVWSFLTRSGRPSICVNIPMTYPPEEISGVMVSGMDAPDSSNYTFPAQLKERIQKQFGEYVVEPPITEHLKKTKSGTLASFIKCNSQRMALAGWLMEETDWDFFMLVFESLDRAQHFFLGHMDWDSLTAEDIEQDVVLSLYIDLDKRVGEFLKRIDTDTSVFVVSDHGFSPAVKRVSVNNWLMQKGYMAIKETPRLRYQRYKEILKYFLKNNLPLALVQKIRKRRIKRSPVKKNREVFKNVDWSKTRVYCEGAAPKLFINRQLIGDDEACERFVSTLISELGALRDLDSKEPLFRKILRRDEVYFGPCKDRAADIILELNKGFLFKHFYFDRFIGNRSFLEPVNDSSGEHFFEGILICMGPSIKPGHKLEESDIIDVVPTVLYLMGEKVPEHLDGKVLTSMISDDHLSENPILTIGLDAAAKTRESSFSEKEKQLLDDRLKELGYL